MTAGRHHLRAEGQEAKAADEQKQPVIHRHVHGYIPYVVQVEKVMVDDALYQIEPTPAKEHLAD